MSVAYFYAIKRLSLPVVDLSSILIVSAEASMLFFAEWFWILLSS